MITLVAILLAVMAVPGVSETERAPGTGTDPDPGSPDHHTATGTLTRLCCGPVPSRFRLASVGRVRSDDRDPNIGRSLGLGVVRHPILDRAAAAVVACNYERRPATERLMRLNRLP